MFHRLDGRETPKYPDDFVATLSEAIRAKVQVAETPYFRCNWYKNANLHIEFMRLNLLKRLNQQGGDHDHVPGSKGRSAG